MNSYWIPQNFFPFATLCNQALILCNRNSCYFAMSLRNRYSQRCVTIGLLSNAVFLSVFYLFYLDHKNGASGAHCSRPASRPRLEARCHREDAVMRPLRKARSTAASTSTSPRISSKPEGNSEL